MGAATGPTLSGAATARAGARASGRGRGRRWSTSREEEEQATGRLLGGNVADIRGNVDQSGALTRGALTAHQLSTAHQKLVMLFSVSCWSM